MKKTNMPMTRYKTAIEQRSSDSDTTKRDGTNKHNNKNNNKATLNKEKTRNSEGYNSKIMEEEGKTVSYKSYAKDGEKIKTLEPAKLMKGKKGTHGPERLKEAPLFTLGQHTQESDEEEVGKTKGGNEKTSIIEITSDDESYDTPYTSPKKHNEDFTNVVVKQEKLDEAEKSKLPELNNWPKENIDAVMMTPDGIAEQRDIDMDSKSSGKRKAKRHAVVTPAGKEPKQSERSNLDPTVQAQEEKEDHTNKAERKKCNMDGEEHTSQRPRKVDD